MPRVDLQAVLQTHGITASPRELAEEATPDRPISPRHWLLAGRDPKPVADLARDL